MQNFIQVAGGLFMVLLIACMGGYVVYQAYVNWKERKQKATLAKSPHPYTAWVEYTHALAVAVAIGAFLYHYWHHPLVLETVGGALAGIYFAGLLGPIFKRTLLSSSWWTDVQPGREIQVVRAKNPYRMVFNPNLPDKKVYFRDARFNTANNPKYWHVCESYDKDGAIDTRVIMLDTDTPSYAVGGRVPAPLILFWWVCNPLRIVNWWLAQWGIIWVGAFGAQTDNPYTLSRWKAQEEAKQRGQEWDELVEIEGMRLVRITDSSNHTRFFPFPLLFVFKDLELGDGRHVTLVLEGRFVTFNPEAARFNALPSFAEITEGSLKQLVASLLLKIRLEDIFPYMLESGKKKPARGFIDRLADEVNTSFASNQLAIYGVRVFQFVVIALAPDQETLMAARKIPDAKVQREADKIKAEGDKALDLAPLEAALQAVLGGLPADVARAVALQNTPGTVMDVGGGSRRDPLVTAAASTIVASKK